MWRLLDVGRGVSYCYGAVWAASRGKVRDGEREGVEALCVSSSRITCRRVSLYLTKIDSEEGEQQLQQANRCGSLTARMGCRAIFGGRGREKSHKLLQSIPL